MVKLEATVVQMTHIFVEDMFLTKCETLIFYLAPLRSIFVYHPGDLRAATSSNGALTMALLHELGGAHSSLQRDLGPFAIF